MGNNLEDISKRLICRTAYYLKCMKRNTAQAIAKARHAHAEIQKDTLCVSLYRDI